MKQKIPQERIDEMVNLSVSTLLEYHLSHKTCAVTRLYDEETGLALFVTVDPDIKRAIESVIPASTKGPLPLPETVKVREYREALERTNLERERNDDK